MPKLTRKGAKKQAWSVFSEYIRLKHARNDGYVECYTCGALKRWKAIREGRAVLEAGIQAGHGIAGRGAALLFRENIVRPQCYGCNVRQSGRLDVFQHKLRQEIGHEAFEEAMKDKLANVKLSLQDFILIRDDYRARAEKLKQERGLV